MPSPSPDDLIPLPQLIRELRGAADILGLERDALATTSYRTAYGAVLDGTIPAEKNGREWAVRRRDLAEVATALGCRPKRGPGRPRSTAAPSNAAGAA